MRKINKNKKNYLLLASLHASRSGRVTHYALRSDGFTLVETLVYITIIAMVVVAFVSFSISVSNSRNKAYVVQEVQANARTTLDLISQRIRAAVGVNTGSCTFGSDPGVLSLAMAEETENPTIIDLDQDNGSLQITQGLGDPVLITSNKVKVTNLVFTNLTPLTVDRENIRVEITLEYDNAGSDIEYTYSQSLQTAVSLRQ